MKVLLLEDDVYFSDEIIKFLTKLNYEVSLAIDGEIAEDLLYSYKFDLLLLDFNVPKLSGMELLNKFRCYGYKTPAIIMTEYASTKLLENCYKVGCDEFIKKPFSLKELEVRINYLRKIFKIKTNEIIQLDQKFSFDMVNLSIIKNQQIIKLPKKEAYIVKYLLCNQDRIISTDELILDVWDYDITPSIATIRTYIKNIRKKFEHRFIETVKGRGYKFNTSF